MIVTLNSRYSWASLLAASEATKEYIRTTPKKQRDRVTSAAFIMAYRACNAVRQHLDLEPVDGSNYALGDLIELNRALYRVVPYKDAGFRYTNKEKGVKGFICVKCNRPQVFDICGYISERKADVVREIEPNVSNLHLTSFFVHEHYFTRWVDRRVIIQVEGR